MKRLNITTKIWLSIGVFIVGFVIVTLSAQVQSRSTESALQTTSDALFPAAQRTQEAESGFQRMVKGFSDAMMTQDAPTLARAADDGRQVAEELETVARIHGLSTERQQEAANLGSSVSQFVRDAQTLYEGILSSRSGLTDQVQASMRDVAGRTDALKANLKQTKEQFANDLQARLNDVRVRSSRQRWSTFILCIVTLVSAIIFVNLTIRRSITRVLTRAVDDLKAAAISTAAAAAEISASSQSVAAGASQQSASLDEVTSSGEEISSMIHKNAAHSKDAAGKMNLASSQIADANARLAEMVTSMNDIDSSSTKVSKIIRTIDEIAFQTNILALNAAVEAARAGEAGMGFAVVADEVRSLAQRCAEAARDTTALIEESLGNSRVGKDKLDRVAETIHSVTTTSSEVKKLVDDIQIASEEQSRGMERVSDSLSQMAQVTSRNAGGAHESALAAEKLTAQALVLETIIGRLAGMVHGSAETARLTR